MNNPALMGDFGPSGGSASFGGSVKKYDVEKSASYDDPSSSPIVVPIPPPAQSPLQCLRDLVGKRNQVTTLSLNSDINQLVSQDLCSTNGSKTFNSKQPGNWFYKII